MLAGAADAAASGSGPPGARRLGELLAPVAEAVRKRLHDEQYNQKRPRDHDDEWEEEYLLCEFEEEAPSLEGEIRVQARAAEQTRHSAWMRARSDSWQSSIASPQALDTATPRVTVNGNTYCGRYSNTVSAVVVTRLPTLITEPHYRLSRPV